MIAAHHVVSDPYIGRMTEPIPVVLDVDTGVDDACALLLAARHPGLDLRAVTCVAGNTELDQVVRNTLTVLDIAGRPDVPVAAGAARPLIEPPRPARHVHGEDGMGDLGVPPSTRDADPRTAIELLRDELLAAVARHERTGERLITLVPMAPMTNIALLARVHPTAFAGLERIVFMGGAVVSGNATAAAEFNVWHDPEATAMVLDAAAAAGVPVTMYGLDVFYDVRVTRKEAEALLAATDPVSRLAGSLIDFQCRRFGEDDATIGDAGAVCAVIDPESLRSKRFRVQVELSGGRTRGQTVVDMRPRTDTDADLGADVPGAVPPAGVQVGLSLDAERYRSMWLETVGGGQA